MADVGEPDKTDRWLSVEDAASLLGLTARRVLRLVSRDRDRIPVRGSRRDPFIRESALRLISAAHERDPRIEPDAESVEQPSEPAPSVPALASIAPDQLVVGDALATLRSWPSDFVQSVVTSPPFWGQRRYEDETAVTWGDGSSVAFGREDDPADYAKHSAELLVELARVLKPRGTIWWNVGDAYWTRTILHESSSERIDHYGGRRSNWSETPDKRWSSGHPFLKDKDLTLTPFLVALEAQRSGLWLRSVIVWSKQQPSVSVETNGHNGHEQEVRAHMPEPVADRPVVGHEYILLFAKSEEYDYHATALSEVKTDTAGPNVRTVWTFRPVGSAAAHGARFPEELPRRCIALGTEKGELVLDPFSGHGTALKVAVEMERRYLGIEVSPTYAEEARATIKAARVPLPVASGSTV